MSLAWPWSTSTTDWPTFPGTVGHAVIHIVVSKVAAVTESMWRQLIRRMKHVSPHSPPPPSPLDVSNNCRCSLLNRECINVLLFPVNHRLVGLVVKASAWRAEDPGFESRSRRDFSRARVIQVTSKLALQWLPCQTPGVIGSELGLAGLVYTVTG